MAEGSGRKVFLSCSNPHFLYDLLDGLQCHAMACNLKLAMGISSTCEI